MTYHPLDDLPDTPVHPSVPGHDPVVESYPRAEMTHEITSRFWPGSYGERPEPWQRTYECVCGEDLGMNEEGAGDVDVEGAFESHLESLSQSSENEE